jgi:hypothetical protein
LTALSCTSAGIAPPGADRDPARLDWHEVTKLAHYYLSVDAMIQPMQVREHQLPYGKREDGA